MDLCVEQADLARALRLVERAVPSRPGTPALGGILITAAPGKLTLAATDLALTLLAAVPAAVDQPGRALLPAQLLAGYVADLPTAVVQLTSEPEHNRVRARCGRVAAAFAALDQAGFPTVPPPDLTLASALDARALRHALARVIPAAARDDSRPVLGAVLFSFGADGATLAAADGFRLAYARLTVTAAPRTALVPVRAATEAVRLCGEADSVQLVFQPDGQGLWLVAGATGLHTRLVAGRFPDIAALLPATWRTRVTVERLALRAALHQAALFGPASPGARPVVLSATPGWLRLGAWGAERGEVQSALPADLAGTPGMTALDTRLLVDLLAGAESDRLTLTWDGPTGAVVIQEVAAAPTTTARHAGALWLVMPLQEPALLRRQAAAEAAATPETIAAPAA
ncbi:MAG TPA: DNA polymerase III subunit beta [Nitrolancea sp.]|nr:DNA polymerase III subunit beta [Nitrolancea sp.]